jgi:RimJ/RimL family protein N-acetyltransferase
MIVLETPRLFLRPPVQADLDGFAAFNADERVTRFLGGVQPRSVAWRGMATLAGSWSLMGFAMFSVIERSSGQWIGRVGPWYPEGWPGTEVGWGLLASAWGKGYATEAAAACIDWAFDNLGWSEVIHTIAADNAPSKAVAARLGSHYLRQGVLPDPISMELEVWGQSRDAWRARPRQRSGRRP